MAVKKNVFTDLKGELELRGNAVHGINNHASVLLAIHEDLEYVEDVVNSYSNATMTFKNAADNGYCGETVPIKTIKVPYARNLTSCKESAPRASPKSSTGIHGCTKPDEHLGFEVQGDDARLLERSSTSGLRRSSRKGKQVCYYEGSRKLARSAPEKPHEGQRIKKKFTCLRIRASNFLSDEDEESER